MPNEYAVLKDPVALAESAKRFGVQVEALADGNNARAVTVARLIYPQGFSPIEAANRDGFGKGNIIVFATGEEPARDYVGQLRRLEAARLADSTPGAAHG